MSAAGQNELLACVHQKTVKLYSDCVQKKMFAV